MHSRLVPLAPAPDAFAQALPRITFPRIPLPSMPWMELGFFMIIIFGLTVAGA